MSQPTTPPGSTPPPTPSPTPPIPSEESHSDDFSIDDFKSAVAASKKSEETPTPPAETPPTEPPVDEELGEIPEIPLDEESTEEPPKPDQPPKPAEQPKPGSRPLDGIPPELHKHMRSMSNEAFGALHNIIKGFYQQKDQIRDLEVKAQEAHKGALSDLEAGYTLTPEYQQAMSVSGSLDTELAHWDEQIAKCQAGENWINVVQGPDGKPVEQETEPGPKALRYLFGKRNAAVENGAKVDQYIENLKAQHVNAYKGVQSWVQSMSTKLFANVKHDFSKDPVYTKLMAPLPPALKGQEIYSIAAKLAVLLYRSSLKQKASAANTQFSKAIESVQGPTSVSAASAPAAEEKDAKVAQRFASIGY